MPTPIIDSTAAYQKIWASVTFFKCGEMRASLLKPVRASLLLLLYPSSLRNRALERKPSYSNRKEPFLMAHQHSFSQDVGPLVLLTGEQRMSRRTIFQRLAGLTLAGGSITSFVTSCGSPPI